MRISAFLVLTVGSLALTACSTYQAKVAPARDSIINHNYENAVQDLKPMAEEESKDQLAYLMDYATALQFAGNYQESNKAFIKADRLAESLDYFSVGKQAASLALSQEMVQYKGDTFEKFFINAMAALNYLALGNMDDALVEARRMNEKYQKLNHENRKDFELNFFGKYLSAMIWEASKNYDDAYIAYSEAYKLDPRPEILKSDLIRSSKLSRRNDDYIQWKKTFSRVTEENSWYDKSKAEVIVILLNGWGPKKVPDPRAPRYPMLAPVYTNTSYGVISVNGAGELQTNEIYDVQQAAIQTLNDDRASLIAKRVAGVATKAVLADQLRQKDEALGFLAWIFLNASDRADVRHWSMLPKNIQMRRVSVSPGEVSLRLQGKNAMGSFTSESFDKKVSLKAGQKYFWILRSIE